MVSLKIESKLFELSFGLSGGYSAPRNGQLDVSNTVNGPWLKMKEFTCLLSRKIEDVENEEEKFVLNFRRK